jgi:hypothetical protein
MNALGNDTTTGTDKSRTCVISTEHGGTIHLGVETFQASVTRETKKVEVA